MSTCECGSGLTSDRCCAQYVRLGATVPTAEALMRSRYFAFAHQDARYLLDSWHQSSRPKTLDFDSDSTQWLKLEIVDCVAGGADDSRGIVEFKAYFLEGGRRHCLHERSSFIRQAGRWYYVDGLTPPTSVQAKVGRNQPCPCGSGKKFKRCCGK